MRKSSVARGIEWHATAWIHALRERIDTFVRVRRGSRAVASYRSATAAKPAAPVAQERWRPKRKRRGALAGMSAIAAYVGLLVSATSMGRIPVPVILMLPIFNLLMFSLYWRNKFASQRRVNRIPEDVLHALAFLGAWPGAWLAQRMLRYEPRTPRFSITFWLVVAAHCAALLAWLLNLV